MKTCFIFTDGSCNIKNQLGGIGVYIKYGQHEKYIKKGFKNTKTGRMEIRAIIEALRTIKKDKSFQYIIYSDSQYCVNSINIWLDGWVRNGFNNIKNQDLWEQFLEEKKKFDFNQLIILWLKGHKLDNSFLTLGNNKADQLASYKEQESYLESDLLI